MRLFSVLAIVMMTGYALPAAAFKWTETETKALPDYCQARYGNKESADYLNWRNTIGPDFDHTHHYCHGLGFLNRYYRSKNTKEKKLNLQSAYGNFIYVIQRVDRSYPMLPEAYMNIGTVLSLQNKDGEALQAMLKAIELDPKLARAYSTAANHYVKLNKREDALRLITEGLRQIPETTSLQRLYVKLGGQLPYPEPAAPQEPKPVEVAIPRPDAEAGAEEVQSAEPVAQTSNAESEKAQEENVRSDEEASAPTKLGSPSNPWCRFCPPEPGQ